MLDRLIKVRTNESARRRRTSSITARGDGDLVFGRSRTEAFVRSTLRSRALKAWKVAELLPFTPHEARHCCASYFSAAGLTPKEVQTALGHADIRTTLNIYAKAVPGWKEQATAKLDAYLGVEAAAVAPSLG